MKAAERPEWLQPGSIIELPDTSYLAEFEDSIVAIIDPTYSPSTWAGRVALKELIRPPRFNGPICDISLTVMDDAYQKLQTVHQRGWSLRRSRKSEAEEDDSFLGFTLQATPRSSRPGLRAEIQAELWYAPIPTGKSTDGTSMAIRRLVTKPKLEAGLFIRHDAAAKRVGIEVFKKATQRPLSGGLPQ